MTDYAALTDLQLAEAAAAMMYGPGYIRTHDGQMWYPPALTGRIIAGLTLELAHELHHWLIYREFSAGKPLNYSQKVLYRQHESARRYDADGVELHPVGQVILYRSIYTREHVIAAGAGMWECVDIDRARAEIVATLKASE